MPHNILFLMTDQHRTDHVSFLPERKLETPNLDRLAGSVGFGNCVSVNPICTPARTALLTGKYTHQIGMLSMSGDLSLQHPTYFRALQGAGYHTAGVGKFHWLQGWPWGAPRGGGHDLVGLKPRMQEFGLDYVWEAAGKQLALKNHCDYCAHLEGKGLLEKYRDHIQSRGPNSMIPDQTSFSGEPWPFDEEDYVDNLTGEKIIEAIRNRPKDRPFCLFGSFCGPHKPYDPPASVLEQLPLEEVDDFIQAEEPLPARTKERLYRLRRGYRAMIRTVDIQVGRILETLEEEGLLDSTVILFTADHGEMLGDHGRMSKMQPWRQSVTVPTAIRHPHYLNRSVNTCPVEITDLTATMLDVAGLDPSEALSKPWPAFHDRVPCRSLMPVVRGESDRVRDFAFSECNNWWQMVQTDEWKYIRYLDWAKQVGKQESLFSVIEDPRELDDRAEDPSMAGTLAGLREQLDSLLDETPPAQLQWAPYGGDS